MDGDVMRNRSFGPNQAGRAVAMYIMKFDCRAGHECWLGRLAFGCVVGRSFHPKQVAVTAVDQISFNSDHTLYPALACQRCSCMYRELLLACSFASTENYLILMVWPCIMDPLRMLINRSVFHDLQWRPENGVKLHVVEKKKGGKGHVATYRYSVTQF